MTMCFTFKLMSSQVRHTALISTLFALLMASGFVFTEINSILFVSEKKTWSFKVSFFSSVYFQFSRFYLWLFNVYGFRLTVVLDTSFFSGHSWIDSAFLGKKNEAHTRQPKTVYLFSVNDNKKNIWDNMRNTVDSMF